jgi:XapX domain-containing protein
LASLQAVSPESGSGADSQFDWKEAYLMKTVLGFALALAIGAACRWFGVPLPAPTTLIGALLVASITLGYLGAAWFLGR